MDRKIANRAIATPIKGVVPHPGATLPYSEFNGFNKLPTLVRLGPDRELSSTICVAIYPIVLYSLRSVDFVYHSVVNKGSYHRSVMILKFYNNGNSNPSRHLYIWITCQFYWVCLIYCFWATLSTTKRSIRGTRGLAEVPGLPHIYIIRGLIASILQ
jgi:hypothetical protein